MKRKMDDKRLHLKFSDYRWQDVPKVEYKKQQSGNTFYKVDRQNIISSADGVDFEVRYFECGPQGFTTLEKHEHVHIVMIARGQGRVIIGESIFEACLHDYFVIPSWAPHQLINAGDEPFAFFCSVNAKRDKFAQLSKDETEKLKESNDVAKWIRIPEGYFDTTEEIQEGLIL